MASHGKYVGFVRLDLADKFYNIFTVSIFVDPEFRKLGVGKQMLGLSLDSVTTDNMGHDFRAVIRRDNIGSIKLFNSFGFEFFIDLDENFHEYRRKSKSDAPGL
jgi:L-amino acid N-acyltransferase YncA